MRRKKIVSMLLVATMAATMFAGCGNDSGKKGSSGGVKEFDAFFAVPGSEINDDNEIQKIIEEKTGVRVKEKLLFFFLLPIQETSCISLVFFALETIAIIRQSGLRIGCTNGSRLGRQVEIINQIFSIEN